MLAYGFLNLRCTASMLRTHVVVASVLSPLPDMHSRPRNTQLNVRKHLLLRLRGGDCALCDSRHGNVGNEAHVLFGNVQHVRAKLYYRDASPSCQGL